VNHDLRRLLRWLRRAQPPASDLARAILTGGIATVTSVGLLVGAIGLLIESARRPGLAAVAGVLIIIEVLAFLRSPLRFFERVSAHRLGFEAVTRWRRWLVLTVGRWDYSRWRVYAAGDLLERSLRDTDELQDLWLRFTLPVISALISLVVSDVVVALLPPHGQWLKVAFWFLLLQMAGVALLVTNLGPLVRAQRTLRHARGAYQGSLVELSAVVPELALLGREGLATAHLAQRRDSLERAEHNCQRVARRSVAVPLVAGLLAMQVLWLDRVHTSPTWLAVIALLGVASADALATVRVALDTAVAVSGSSERLEELEQSPFREGASVPLDATIRGEHVTLIEEGIELVRDATFTFTPGQRVAIVGPSGTGKSTFLRSLVGLDQVSSGRLSIGGVPIGEIAESQLRDLVSYVASEPGLTRGFAQDVVGMGRHGLRDSLGELSDLGVRADPMTRFDELSRGERQRVAMVRALVTEPRVLVADEPTSGLGSDETDEMLALLTTLNATIVVATHDERVERWCDAVYELVNGELRLISR
jgi:ABC-type transport system involved in cytochrome bd biosynthesis fused ATPase/permease subunit